ncbi:MAG: DUF2203 domain-containing protein [Actinomycetota bacterium]
MAEREFTVEEANSLLPALSRSLTQIKEARQAVLHGGERIRRSARWDGGGSQGKEYWDALSTLRREVESLSEQGIVLRDAEEGLLDFPARREGRQVFLCWRLGEVRVGYWHGPETGFAGRRPL